MAPRTVLPYNPALKILARKLRKGGILSEVVLWNEIKGKRVMGYKFTRQKPIDEYIVDFFCHELMLAIEIDGHSHDSKLSEDAVRQKKLESMGVTVLRFLDTDVKNNLEGVILAIQKWIRQFG